MIMASLPAMIIPPVGLSMFAAGWTLQGIGHAVKGNPPKFFGDKRNLLVGAIWWFERCCARWASPNRYSASAPERRLSRALAMVDRHLLRTGGNAARSRCSRASADRPATAASPRTASTPATTAPTPGAQPGTAATPVPVDIRQCIGGCQCHACSAGLRCLTDGRCVDEDCLDVTCPEGSLRAGDASTAAPPSGARLCLRRRGVPAGTVRLREATRRPTTRARAILDSWGRRRKNPWRCTHHGLRMNSVGARDRLAHREGALWGLAWVLARRRRRRSVE
ncbi:MAG: hypothetical protein IPN17_21080 [Deltaproteobacteria bacterium]|nr:hypothetical protein [Deltaproteobacteria bacterium]